MEYYIGGLSDRRFFERIIVPLPPTNSTFFDFTDALVARETVLLPAQTAR
jgi:hypothetical protein